MKAIRKSDGAIIDVRLYDVDTAIGKFVFTDDSTNTHYNKADLDFNVEEAEQTESAVTSGWVCRDEHSDLYVVIGDKPKRTGFGFWENESADCITLPTDSFPSLTWQSDPLEVTITITIKQKKI